MDFSIRVLDGDDRHAVVLPGGEYPVTAPVLWYASAALSFQGWTVHLITWPKEVSRNDVLPLTTGILEGLDDGSKILVVGKSLGSLAMPLAVERGLPGVWLTPLLTQPWIADAARRLGPEHLLVGGTGDGAWDSSVASAGTARVLEIADADHALQVPGDLDRTLAAIASVAWAVDEFARGLSV